MVKKKKAELEVGTLNDIPVESFISTGFPEVDEICGGGFPRKRVTEIWGLPGCFTKGTPVLTDKGYKPIESIVNGDRVASFDGIAISYNKATNSGAIANKPKPMIQFSHGDDTITATYDHPFYNGDKYYPLYQLAWGDMEEGQRVQLQLLCEQYGQTFNYEVERGLTHSDTQTWERPYGASSDSDERKDYKSTPSSSSDMGAKSEKSTLHQPQGLQPSEQQGNKSGVVHPEGEQPTRIPERETEQIFGGSQRSGKASLHKVRQEDTQGVQGRVGHTYSFIGENGQETEGCIQRVTSEIPTDTARHYEKGETAKAPISGFVVKEAEPYYALSVENVHTYIVGYSQFPVHNTGKSHLLAKCMATLDGKVLYIDSEFALNKDRLKALGVDLDKVHYLANSQLEKVTEHILEHLNEYDLIIIDTLAKLTPMTIEENEVGANAIGLFARQVSHFEAKLRPKLYASETAIVAISQARANFGMGMVETKPSSTFAWKHTIDLSLKLSKGANNKLYKQSEGVRREVGHIVTVKLEKNKMGPPGQVATFELFY